MAGAETYRIIQERGVRILGQWYQSQQFDRLLGHKVRVEYSRAEPGSIGVTLPCGIFIVCDAEMPYA